MYDPDLYRTKEEIERYKQRDPIAALSERLRASGALTDAALQEIEGSIAQEIDEAVTFAREGTLEPVDELERFVYWEEPAA